MATNPAFRPMSPDELSPRLIAQGTGRVVRPMGEDDPDLPKGMRRLPRQQEEEMPKGIYNRKPKEDAANDAPAAPQKQARKPRTLAVVPKVAKPSADVAKGRFDVSLDLRGGAVTINAANGSLTLSPDEVLALFAFMGRR